MAKKKNQSRRDNEVKAQSQTEVRETKPSFEIGVRGDEFERRYHRAAMSSYAPADRLLNSLSRESRADKYNFLGLAIPALLILIIALSLTIISRGDIEQQLSVQPSVRTVINGEYFKNLNEVYEQTVPFKDGAVRLCAAIGLCEAPAELPEDPVAGDDSTVPEPPDIPEPIVTQATEPIITTAPPETEPPVTVETEATEPEYYETYIMYATATVNVRFGPSTDEAILGNYVQNEEIEVIAIREDGWAEVLFNGMKAYAYAEYMSETKVKAETTRRRSRTDATTTEPEETTFDDENGDVTSVPEGDGGDITSVPEGDGGGLDPDENDQSPDESVTLEDEPPMDDGGQTTDDGSAESGETTSEDDSDKPWWML